MLKPTEIIIRGGRIKILRKKIRNLKWKTRKTEVQEGEEKTREDRKSRR